MSLGISIEIHMYVQWFRRQYGRPLSSAYPLILSRFSPDFFASKLHVTDCRIKILDPCIAYQNFKTGQIAYQNLRNTVMYICLSITAAMCTVAEARAMRVSKPDYRPMPAVTYFFQSPGGDTESVEPHKMGN